MSSDNTPSPFEAATPEQVQEMIAAGMLEATCPSCGNTELDWTHGSWHCPYCNAHSAGWDDAVAREERHATWTPVNTIDVKHDLLRFSDGDNVMSRPGDEVRDLDVSFVRSDGSNDTYGVFVYGPGLGGDYINIWTYECGSMEEAHELHDKVFNAWVDARVVAGRSR